MKNLFKRFFCTEKKAEEKKQEKKEEGKDTISEMTDALNGYSNFFRKLILGSKKSKK